MIPVEGQRGEEEAAPDVGSRAPAASQRAPQHAPSAVSRGPSSSRASRLSLDGSQSRFRSFLDDETRNRRLSLDAGGSCTAQRQVSQLVPSQPLTPCTTAHQMPLADPSYEAARNSSRLSRLAGSLRRFGVPRISTDVGSATGLAGFSQSPSARRKTRQSLTGSCNGHHSNMLATHLSVDALIDKAMRQEQLGSWELSVWRDKENDSDGRRRGRFSLWGAALAHLRELGQRTKVSNWSYRCA